MIGEQFVYGLFKDSGYITLKTNGVNALLSKQSLNQLKELRLSHNEEPRTIPLRFKTEDVLTVSKLYRSNDKYGRAGFINHTIIISLTDYLTHFPLTPIITPYFLTKTTKPPTLQPLSIR